MSKKDQQDTFEQTNELATVDSLGGENKADQRLGEVLISWEFPEFIKFDRGFWWYVVASVIALGLLAYAFFTDNRLFMIIIVLTVIIFVIANSRSPERVAFALTDTGVIVKDKFIPYPEITNFWIIYLPPHVKTLYLEPRSIFSPRIQVHLEGQNPSEVREILLQFLYEDLEKEEEPQSETFGRLLRF